MSPGSQETALPRPSPQSPPPPGYAPAQDISIVNLSNRDTAEHFLANYRSLCSLRSNFLRLEYSSCLLYNTLHGIFICDSGTIHPHFPRQCPLFTTFHEHEHQVALQIMLYKMSKYVGSLMQKLSYCKYSGKTMFAIAIWQYSLHSYSNLSKDTKLSTINTCSDVTVYCTDPLRLINLETATQVTQQFQLDISFLLIDLLFGYRFLRRLAVLPCPLLDGWSHPRVERDQHGPART